MTNNCVNCNASIEYKDKVETLIDVPDELYEDLRQKLSVLKKKNMII